ncbi:MAG: ABC transporter permease [Pseudomonadales bacterium]
MMLIKIAFKSLLNRKVTLSLTVLSIAVSVMLLLGVEHVRKEAKESFGRTVSGVDLIVGARTSQLNLLLYSVFHIGNATNNISWPSYQRLAANPKVAWSIPLSLGDSHRGYRVMGTSDDYFKYFRYGSKQLLGFVKGKPFEGVFDVVLGYEVAQQLRYQLGQKIVLAHGLGKSSFTKHDDKPFRVVGILKPTGTPVDQTLHVSLAGIEAIHLGWQNGVKTPGLELSAEQALQHDLRPKTVTAFMLGLKSKMATFQVQREINKFKKEPLMAILPGVALAELWQMMAGMEKLLLLISALVLIASLLGMSTMLLASMRERIAEMAVLRAVGASPWVIFLLIELEALLIASAGIVFAMLGLWIALVSSQDILSVRFGLFVSANLWSIETFNLFAVILGATFMMALIPAVGAYRSSLHVGLSQRK